MKASLKAKLGRSVGSSGNSDSEDSSDSEGVAPSQSAAAAAASAPSQSQLRSRAAAPPRPAPDSDVAKLANDPSAAFEMAVGDPFPELVPQDRDDPASLRLTGVCFDENKRYLFKNAHFSAEDRRLFDVESGAIVLVSHHEGKNPYESIDPLGYNESATGEWKSLTSVSSVSDPRYPSFTVRPKKLSRHGTQYVDLDGDDEDVVLNVAKMSKFKSKSPRPHFVVGRGKEAGKGDKMVYKIEGDLIGRTLRVENARGELVAVMAKTNKALLKTAVFGSGGESTVDVAPGVDCAAILAVLFAVGQVGAHYVKDAFANYVQDPVQDAVVESAMGAATGDALGDAGAVGELAEDVGLGDALEDGAEWGMDLAGETIGFFADLFGGD